MAGGGAPEEEEEAAADETFETLAARLDETRPELVRTCEKSVGL